MLRKEAGRMIENENVAHERCDFCGDEARVAISEKVGLRSRICESCATWAIIQLTPPVQNPQDVIGTRSVATKPSETRPVDPDRITMGSQ